MEGAAEERKTTIIATIARMNPPTPGHLLLIQTMFLEAARKSLPQIFIILSNTTSISDIKNPLDCETKRDILNNSIERLQTHLGTSIHVEIICMNDNKVKEYALSRYEDGSNSTGILPSIRYLLHNWYNWPDNYDIILHLFIGADREQSYGFVGASLQQETPRLQLEQTALQRPSMYELASIDRLRTLTTHEELGKIPAESMSATLVRTLVATNLKFQFDEIMKRAYLSPREIEALWSKLRSHYEVAITKTKTPTPSKSIKKSAKVRKSAKVEKSAEETKTNGIKQRKRGGKRKYTIKKKKSNKRTSKNQFKKRFKYLSSFIHI